MRAHQLGFLGLEPVKTPNLDKFAKQSLVLHQAVANYPVCSPYRAMLMTGKYAPSNKVTSNCTNHSEPYNCELQENDVCWSDVLKENGYSLGYIGKWHLDSPKAPYIDCLNNHGDVKWNEWCPPNRRHGFDFWYSYGTYAQHLNPMYWDNDAGREEFKYVDQWGPEHEADLAIEYLKNTDGKYRDEDKPFAMVVSMNPPHTPYDQVPGKYVKMYDHLDVEELCKKPRVSPKGTQWGDFYRKNVLKQYAMVTGVDEQFGRIMDALSEQGLAEDTIVLFTADHGDCVGVHDHHHKNIEYEESMRIPFLIRWPGKIKPRHDDLLISVPDYYPTLIDLMGFEEVIPQDVEGKSFAEYFLQAKGTKPNSQLYCFMKFDAPEFGKRGVRTHTHTLSIEIYPDSKIDMVLFDNVHDPYQMVNVATGNKELIEKLIKSELVPWLEVSHDPWLELVPGLLKEMDENWVELSADFGEKATERVRPFQQPADRRNLFKRTN
jgi:arylsulfatase A-like enzyme